MLNELLQLDWSLIIDFDRSLGLDYVDDQIIFLLTDYENAILLDVELTKFTSIFSFSTSG